MDGDVWESISVNGDGWGSGCCVSADVGRFGDWELREGGGELREGGGVLREEEGCCEKEGYCGKEECCGKEEGY